MKWISFSLNYWLYPMLMSIFNFLQTLTGSKLQVKSLVFIPLFNSFSHLFAILQEDAIFFLRLNKRKSKTMKQKIRSFDFAMKNELLRVKKKFKKKLYITGNKKSFYLLFLALGLTNCFSHSIYLSYTSFNSSGYCSITVFIGIAFTSLLCYFILKTKLYRHHYLAIAIFAVDIVIYFSIRGESFNLYVMYNYGWGTFTLLFMLYIIPTSFREVTEKYITQTYFISAPMILFSESVFSLSVFIIYFIIIQYVPCENLGYFMGVCAKSKWFQFANDLINHFDYGSIQTLWGWGYVISTYFANLYRVETIKYLSPTHRFVGEMFFNFYWLIHNAILNSIEKTLESIFLLDRVQVIPLLFATFVFNEFIIIRLGKLHHNTHLEITARAENETKIVSEFKIIEYKEIIDNAE